MIARPQPIPTVSWKKIKIAWKTEINGERIDSNVSSIPAVIKGIRL
jgi:hypothetical protein